MYQDNGLEITGGVRSPIQCKGLDRGPKRIAEVAVNGSVNAQGWLDDIIGAATKVGKVTGWW
jgi:hypothetical protein